MGIEQASYLGSIDDVANMVQVFGILTYFVMPFILVLLIVYFVRYMKKRSAKKKAAKLEKEKQLEIEKQAKKIQKEQIEKQKVIIKNNRIKANKIFNDKEYMLRQLDDIKEPAIKSEYRNLAINFDKNGKMIKEK